MFEDNESNGQWIRGVLVHTILFFSSYSIWTQVRLYSDENVFSKSKSSFALLQSKPELSSPSSTLHLTRWNPAFLYTTILISFTYVNLFQALAEKSSIEGLILSCPQSLYSWLSQSHEYTREGVRHLVSLKFETRPGTAIVSICPSCSIRSLLRGCWFLVEARSWLFSYLFSRAFIQIMLLCVDSRVLFFWWEHDKDMRK